MANIKTLFVLVAVCLVAVFAVDNAAQAPLSDNSPTIRPNPTPKPTEPPTPKPTEPPTPAPTEPPTPKPTPPPTPKPTPPPTPKPTPPPTPKPTPPPTPKPTTAPTTPKPTPKPTPPPSPVDPKQGQWVANYTGTNTTCIVLDVATQVTITYKNGNDSKTLGLNVPIEAIATGVCGGAEENITLTWQNAGNATNLVTFTFNKTKTQFDLEAVEINLNLTLPGLNNSLYSFTHKRNEFPTPLSRSYKCTKTQSLNLTTGGTQKVVAELRVSHLQMQAYRNATGTNFAEALDCSAAETPDVVPIAVGCALAALVIVVLIAYLVGRRRSQARGYLSM